MKQFFKFLFASILGFFISGIILLLFFFMILVASVGGVKSFFGDKEPFQVKENSVLHIKLDEAIFDRASRGFDLEFPSFQPKKEMGLDDILENIKKAKNDDRIKGIYLDLSSIPAGISTIEEIRDALIDFKTSEKWMVGYGEYYDQKAYYLASVADEIYLYPEGAVDFRGLNTTVAFLKGTFEKLDIDMQIVRGKNNKFKSAVEPLMYEEMSEANKEQTSKILSSVWNYMLQGISTQRNVDVAALQLTADSLAVRKAEDAVNFQLVDKLMYKDELLAGFRSRLEIEEDDKINFVPLKKYAQTGSSDNKDGDKEEKKSWKIKDKIAVVYAMGPIESGSGDEKTIGSDRISAAIRKARKDTTVKAIVLRVNSPGGSALASDVIWREAVLAKAEKPFIVSMGDVAASGGYYIACAADRIFASPLTITGSIGVFGVIPNLKGFFNNKLGITFDGVKTNTYADIGNTTRPLSDNEYRIIQESVENVYDVFLTRVSDGRDMPKEEVDEIGQGRVWSGSDAKDIGLVDEFGGLTKSIAYAAEMAGIEDYKVKSLPEQKDPFEQLVKEFTSDLETRVAAYHLGQQYKYYRSIKEVSEWEQLQTRMPYSIEIR